MQVSVIAVGKVKDRYINEGIAEYEKRLRPYPDLRNVEVRDEKGAEPCRRGRKRSGERRPRQPIIWAMSARQTT